MTDMDALDQLRESARSLTKAEEKRKRKAEVQKRAAEVTAIINRSIAEETLRDYGISEGAIRDYFANKDK